MKRSYRYAAFVALIIIPGFSCQEGSKENVYKSTSYGFSFSYPNQLSVDEYQNDNRFALKQGESFIFEFSVFDIDEWLPLSMENLGADAIGCDQPFCIVAVERAVTFCAADGPDGSIYGHAPRIEEKAVSRHGLPIVRFYMKCTEEKYTEDKVKKETRDIGPYYAVAIRDNRVLLVTYAPWDLASDEVESMLHELVNSIRG